MTRPIPTLLTLLLLAIGLACEAEQEKSDRAATPAPLAEQRPTNVVLITVDTTRADALGSYGQPLESSPNIDRLAQQGVLFEQAVASSPNTLPSHSTIFTGKLPYAHGARSNSGYVLSKQNVTLAEVLRDAGYRTEAQVAAHVMRKATQVAQGFESYVGPDSEGVELKEVTYKGEREGEPGDVIEFPIRTAADISRHGIRFIRGNRNRPFFLWLHYFDPHHPYFAPAAFVRKLPGEAYHAEVASADAEIGRVIQTLLSLGLKDRTLVVVTSDHGEGLGEHEEDTHSYYLYESTLRIPLVFWGPPALERGLRVSSVVRSADIAPTVLDLLSQPPLEQVQGVSLRPLLTGEQTELDLTAYGESIEHHTTFATSPLRSLRKGHWKYIHKVNPELYDLKADPDELTNLAAREPEKLAEMRSALLDLLEAAPAPPSDSTTGVDAATRDQLVALGYVGAGAASPVKKESDWFEVEGVDPSAKVEDVELLAVTYGYIKGKRFHLALPGVQDLMARYPESDMLRNIYIQVLVGLEEVELALEQLGKNPKLDIAQLQTYRELAEQLEAAGRDEEAAELRAGTVLIAPCDSGSRLPLYLFFHGRQRYEEEMQMLEEGVRACPDSFWNVNTYAWALATTPVDSLRDGQKAVSMAERALSLAESKDDPSILDTLAAAQAEAGDFAAAIATSEKAVRLAGKQGKMPPEAVANFEKHLAEYRAGRPVRSP